MNTLMAYSYLVCSNEIILGCCTDAFIVFLVAKYITHLLSNLEHINIEHILNYLNLGITLKYNMFRKRKKTGA